MDYRLEMKIRNNRILELIEETGAKTIGEFCRINEVVAKDNGHIGDLVNMKVSPLNREGDFTPVVKRLCDALVCSPEDLFTHDQMMAELETNKRTLKVNEAQVKFMLSHEPEQVLLEDMVAKDQLDTALAAMVEELTPREAKVIKMRFGLEGTEPMTLNEVAKKFDVCGQRIRQIEMKALRKMRHPKRHKEVRDLMESIPN